MSEMPATDTSARGLDAVAVDAALRRLSKHDEAPWLHREIARRMAEKLSLIRLQPARLIDWWGALGAGREWLEQAYPRAEQVIVEPDAVWRARSEAASRHPWWTPRRWQAPPTRVIVESDRLPAVQLVWANMMLHAVADPPALFARWQQALEVDGFVMFSCLGPGTLRELRALYGRLGWSAATPSFVDMHDLGDMLVHAGFADPVMDQEVITLQWGDAESLLAELRGLGGNASPQRHAGLRTPRWRSRLSSELAALADAQGRISMSFEVAYGHAFRAAPRARVSEVTSVPLDDMRTLIRGRNHGPVR